MGAPSFAPCEGWGTERIPGLSCGLSIPHPCGVRMGYPRKLGNGGPCPPYVVPTLRNCYFGRSRPRGGRNQLSRHRQTGSWQPWPRHHRRRVRTERARDRFCLGAHGLRVGHRGEEPHGIRFSGARDRQQACGGCAPRAGARCLLEICAGLEFICPRRMEAIFECKSFRKNELRKAGERIRTADVQLGKLAFYH